MESDCYRTYCIGGRKTKPLFKCVKIHRDAINKDAQLGVDEISYSDKQVIYLCADITELRDDTGFILEFTFVYGIVETLNKYRNRLK